MTPSHRCGKGGPGRGLAAEALEVPVLVQARHDLRGADRKLSAPLRGSNPATSHFSLCGRVVVT